jgi:hypothetical protein
MNMDELAEFLRRRICPDCRFKSANSCDLAGPDPCKLFELFPLVAQAILGTESDRLEDYLQAIEEDVCAVCVNHSLDGTCPRRNRVCALDGQLPAIVDAINEATGKLYKIQART